MNETLTEIFTLIGEFLVGYGILRFIEYLVIKKKKEKSEK